MHIKYVLPFSVMSLLACAAPAGFNVWLLPVSLSLYGPNAIFSMANGIILYSFACQTLMCGFVTELLSQKMRQSHTSVTSTASTIIYPLGLVMSGLSLQYVPSINQARESRWMCSEPITRVVRGLGHKYKNCFVAIVSNLNNESNQKTDTSSSISGSSSRSMAALIKLLSFGSKSRAVKKHRKAFSGFPILL